MSRTADPRVPDRVTPRRRLDRAAFNRPTLDVARDLVGKFIVRKYRGRELSGMITEVEAYRGPRDRASHAYGGRRTTRVEPLYGDGGTAYVYLVYGIHWLFNVSTVGAESPEGILVRAIVADLGDGRKEAFVGPGRVSRYLRVDHRLTGADLTRSGAIWLEDRGVRIPSARVRRGPRVGIDYAGAYWAARPWRFWIEGDAIEPRSRRPVQPAIAG